MTNFLFTDAPKPQPLEELEHGLDGAIAASDWTRLLLADEARERPSLMRATGKRATVTRDIFAALYGMDPVAMEPPVWAPPILDAVRGSEAWDRVSALAAGDPWGCGLGTQAVLAACADKIDAAIQAIEKAEEAQEKADKDEATKAEKNAADMAQRRVTQALAQVTRASEGALGKAAASGEEVLEAARALGTAASKADGSSPTTTRLDTALKRALERSPQLAKISRLAGRMAATGAAKARRSHSHGIEETVGTTLGGLDELARILPSEMLLAGDPDLEVLLAQKLIERQALAYEVKGSEPEDRGPMVVLVDESSSMEHNSRNEWSHAAALALIIRCRQERRDCLIQRFNAKVFAEHTYLARSRTEEFSWVGRNHGGGTSLWQGLMTAHSAIKSGGAFKRADVVLITDADDSPPVDRVEAMREEGIEVSLVQIGRNRNQDAEEDDVINVAMYARACRVTDEQIASGNFDAAEDVFI